MDNTQAIEALKAARANLEKGWCKGWFAKNKDGEKTTSRSKEACEWCLQGGIFSAIDWEKDAEGKALPAIYSAIESVITKRSEEKKLTLDKQYSKVVWYNDSVAEKKEDILSLIDEAIECLGK